MKQIAKTAMIQLLRGYKWLISPMLPPACRYVPSCSEYAMEAIDRRGVLRGGVMAIGRLLRCHPFVKGGYDPAPDRVAPDALVRGGRALAQVHKSTTH